MKNIRLRFTVVAALGYFLASLAAGVAGAGAYALHCAAAQLGLPGVMPIALGANTLGTLVGAQIIQRALGLTFQKFPALNAFSMGFKELDGSVAGANLGQDVYSRIRGTSTVSNFDTAASDFNMTDVPGKLRNFRQIYHKFSAAELNSTSLALVDQTAEPMALALAQSIVASMTSMVSRFNFNTTVNSQLPTLTVASGWTYANTLMPTVTALDTRGVSPTGRFLMVNGAVNGALLTDTALVAALNAPWNAEAVRDGKMAQIVAGLAYDKFGAIAPTDATLIGFAGTKEALLYISRAPKSPDEVFSAAASRAPFNYGIITEPNSGFSVMVQQWIDTSLTVHTRLAWLDGYSVGNPACLLRLVSAVVSGTSGTIVAGKVENPGYGYVNGSGVATAPTLAITGGGGSGATATAQIDTVGGLTGVTITGAGTGYTSVPTITITPSSRCAAPATISLTVAGYA